MAKNYKKIILDILVIATAFAVLVGGEMKLRSYLKFRAIEEENQEVLDKFKDVKTVPTLSTNTGYSENGLLMVPFICQAPLETVQNWKLHETSCEEAALLQAYLYETNSDMTKEKANQEILKMKDWENLNMNGEHDLYGDDMKKFMMGYYGLKDNQVKIIYKASIEDIKTEINAGHPVIAPVTAKLIGNPYYPYPGYHMLTVIGYTSDKIITNDNGTRHGKSFSYDTAIFKKAMDDAGGDVIILSI